MDTDGGVELQRTGDPESVEVNLTKFPKAYSRYQQVAGNELRLAKYGGKGCMDALNKMVQGRGPVAIVYKQRKKFGKEAASHFISGVIRDYRMAARVKLLKEFPDLKAYYDVHRKSVR